MKEEIRSDWELDTVRRERRENSVVSICLLVPFDKQDRWENLSPTVLHEPTPGSRAPAVVSVPGPLGGASLWSSWKLLQLFRLPQIYTISLTRLDPASNSGISERRCAGSTLHLAEK